MNCKPGDLAIVVAEIPGCECNIGALVRVLQPSPDDQPGWYFEDATRPLKCLDGAGRNASWVTHSRGDPPWVCFVHDRHLVPIRPGDMQDEAIDSKELEAA